MPPVCLWELAEIFRGNPRVAFRRLSRRGVRANLEGLNFNVYYFTPRRVQEWFGGSYRVVALEGLSVFTPTAESRNFARQHPHLYRSLSWLDDRLSTRWPWVGCGDFFILSLRRESGN
jgi:hypothetical protein